MLHSLRIPIIAIFAALAGLVISAEFSEVFAPLPLEELLEEEEDGDSCTPFCTVIRLQDGHPCHSGGPDCDMTFPLDGGRQCNEGDTLDDCCTGISFCVCEFNQVDLQHPTRCASIPPSP